MQPKPQAGQPSSRPSTSGSTISSTAQAAAARPARSSFLVRPHGGACGLGRDQAGHGGGEHDPDRHVDGEHRAPAGAEQVRGHHHAAQHQPGHRARGEHRRVGGQRPGPGRAGEVQLDDAEDLRDQHRGARALDEPEADQRLAVRRQRAGQRRGGEDEHAGQVGSAPAVAVAEPGAGNQQHRVRDRVAAHHQLQRRAGGVQAGGDRRHGHVGHQDVDDAHELAEQQHGQHEPAGARGGRAARGGRCPGWPGGQGHRFLLGWGVGPGKERAQGHRHDERVTSEGTARCS